VKCNYARAALLALGVTTFLFLGAALDAASLYSGLRPMSAGDLVLGLSGWFIATFGPIVVAGDAGLDGDAGPLPGCSATLK